MTGHQHSSDQGNHRKYKYYAARASAARQNWHKMHHRAEDQWHDGNGKNGMVEDNRRTSAQQGENGCGDENQ